MADRGWLRPQRERRLPRWAQWSPAAAERPWSVGAEEEVALADLRTGVVANRVDAVLARLPPELAARATAETHACVLEVSSAPHATAGGLAAELAATRRTAAALLAGELGLVAVPAGTHPLARPRQVEVSGDRRHREIDATMRGLAHRTPTMALHVHVAVPEPAVAVRALDGLRADLPLLLALAANSPYDGGRDTGFASMRTPIFSGFPRVGIPRRFGSYHAYVEVVDRMLRSRAVPDPSFLWWDVRLRPCYGTVEVRVMDQQTRVEDAAAVAALVQCLVRLHAEGRPRDAVAAEILDENRFLAARDGIGATFVDPRGRRRPAREELAAALDACAPVARALRCADELQAVPMLAGVPGHERQRRVVVREGLARLPGRLGEAYAPGTMPVAGRAGAGAAAA